MSSEKYQYKIYIHIHRNCEDEVEVYVYKLSADSRFYNDGKPWQLYKTMTAASYRQVDIGV